MWIRLLLCLAPALLAFVLVQLMGSGVIDADRAGGVVFPICLVLLFAGAVSTGVVVASFVVRALKDPVWVGVLLGLLTFFVVGALYLGVTLFGGCLLVVANSGNL